MKQILHLVFLILLTLSFPFALSAQKRQMEYLDRGLVAVKVSSGVYLSWRFLGTDDPETGFNVYRDNVLLNGTPITNSTNYTDATGTASNVYKVVPVLNGAEDQNGAKTEIPWAQQYKTIQLNRPANGITEPNKYGSVGKTATASFPNGQPYGYSPNDCSVGDLDGDGEYEIVVKWDPSNSQDNSYYGITGEVFIDAYKLDGTQLWRISLGKNIRAGAHYTQFLVYDFDGDGLAELICKTAPGTRDGEGKKVIMGSDSPDADYRYLDITQTSGSKMLGTIQTSPEYLTLFDGRTGAELNTVTYSPLRSSSGWGDAYYNRSDRFLACVAYLDGTRPSAVMCRGYYTRATLVAYDVINKKLEQRWFYDSGTTAGVGAYGQGNHNLSVADVDDDGKDEIIYGACAIDHDGQFMYRTGYGHGDAMHVSDMDPDNPGLEVWTVHEETSSAYGYELHDAKTGAVLWGTKTGTDVGRGLAADIDSRYPGFEMWSTGGTGTYTRNGVQISTSRPSVNFRIYWDDDLQDELLDGNKITKWTGSGTTTLLTASGTSSCNSTKATPNLSADILGDWREELVLWTSADSSQLRIYTTTIPTSYRLFTPMHDAVYRLGIAWQNVAYNQPPHLGFYIGGGLDNVSQPDIATIRYDRGTTAVANRESGRAIIYSSLGMLGVKSSETISKVEIYSVSGVLLHAGTQVNHTEFSCPLPENGKLFIVKVKTLSGTQTGKIIR
ncbi:MAG: rhamnogalacturonan lyase [Breznakibacter sp.]